MSIADKYRPQFTYDDYCLWEGQWELIDGMPYAMSPSPVRKHQVISGNLFSILKASAERQCSHCKVYLPLDWKINEKTVVQPDLFIVGRPFEDDFLNFPPALIIEILSPSTAFKDRHEKFELYAEEQVNYYLIVEPQSDKIEIFELVDGNYQQVSVQPLTFEFTLDNDCRMIVDFSDAFA